MIRYSRSQLARAFVHLHDRHPMGPLVAALAQELVAKGRTIDVDSVVAEIARHLLMMRKTLLAEVTTVRPLGRSTIEALKATLARATGATTVRLDVRIDPALIGGCVVRTPGRELDASVAGTLKHILTL